MAEDIKLSDCPVKGQIEMLLIMVKVGRFVLNVLMKTEKLIIN